MRRSPVLLGLASILFWGGGFFCLAMSSNRLGFTLMGGESRADEVVSRLLDAPYALFFIPTALLRNDVLWNSYPGFCLLSLGWSAVLYFVVRLIPARCRPKWQTIVKVAALSLLSVAATLISGRIVGWSDSSEEDTVGIIIHRGFPIPFASTAEGYSIFGHRSSAMFLLDCAIFAVVAMVAWSAIVRRRSKSVPLS